MCVEYLMVIKQFFFAKIKKKLLFYCKVFEKASNEMKAAMV